MKSSSAADSISDQSPVDSPSIPKVVLRLTVIALVSAAIAWLGAVVSYRGLEERDRRLARQEVLEYIEKSRERVQQLKELPEVQELEIRILPQDDTRLQILGKVEDRSAEHRVRDELDDIKHERFEADWQIERLQHPPGPRPRELVIPSLGVVRAYSVRSTLAAGVAGILFAGTFTILALLTFRKLFR